MTTLLDAINALQEAQHITEEVASLEAGSQHEYYAGKLDAIAHIVAAVAKELDILQRD